MDNVRWWHFDGRYHAGGRDVPAVAPHHAFGSVVFKYWHAWPHWIVLRDCDCAVDFLYNHRHRGESWDLDIPPIIRRRWLCTSFSIFLVQ